MRNEFLAFSFHAFAASSMASPHIRGGMNHYGPTQKIEDGGRRLVETEYLMENMQVGDEVKHRVSISLPNNALLNSMDLCLLQQSYWTADPNENKAKWLKGGTTAQDIYSNVTTYIGDSAFAVAEFIDYNFSVYGNADDYVYKLLSNMSTDEDDWENGIASMNENGHGLDIPQAQYDAIVFAAGDDSDPNFPMYDSQPPCGWRLNPEASVRTMVVVTDSPFQVPSAADPSFPHINDHNTTVAALEKQKIRVIGLTTKSNFSELQNLAADTDGSVQTLAPDGSNYVDALMGGIESLVPRYDSVTSDYTVVNDETDALDIIIDPSFVADALPGRDVSFWLTLRLDDDPEQSQINATVNFYLDGQLFHDIDIIVNVDGSNVISTTTTATISSTATASPNTKTKKIVKEYSNTVTSKQITETSSTNKTSIVEEELLS